MERWIQRQLAQEGDRLHQLRQRLWAGVTWQRQDRVLLLGCHSLLWALDPLRQAPEGGVTLVCPSPEDRQRLAAQVDLLEPERQPQLVDGLEALPSDQIFDWIGGRLGTADLLDMNWDALVQSLTVHSTDHTGLRLLISCAERGPAGALSASNAAATSLSTLVSRNSSGCKSCRSRPSPSNNGGGALTSNNGRSCSPCLGANHYQSGGWPRTRPTAACSATLIQIHCSGCEQPWRDLVQRDCAYRCGIS